MKDLFKKTAALVAEPIRATILWTLLDGKAMTATELAMSADTSASNISMHLAKLVKGGLLKAENHGRHRYYTFSGEKVAHAVEALAALMPDTATKKSLDNDTVPAVQKARTCYDHIAGKAGVVITDAMIKQKLIITGDRSFELSGKGNKWFADLNINADALILQRRSFLRPCLDWSERRYHMAGSLAAALLDTMLAEDWIRRVKSSRAVIVTGKGEKKFYETLRITL